MCLSFSRRRRSRQRHRWCGTRRPTSKLCARPCLPVSRSWTDPTHGGGLIRCLSALALYRGVTVCNDITWNTRWFTVSPHFTLTLLLCWLSVKLIDPVCFFMKDTFMKVHQFSLLFVFPLPYYGWLIFGVLISVQSTLTTHVFYFNTVLHACLLI